MTNNNGRKTALDFDTLAGFIDGTLSSEERARVIEVLNEDEDAFELFTETLLNILAVEESPTDTGPGEKFSILPDSNLAAIGAPSGRGSTERRGTSNAESSGVELEESVERSTERPLHRLLSRVLPAAAVLLVAVAALITHSLRSGEERATIDLDALVANASLAGAANGFEPAWMEHGWPTTRGSEIGMNEESRAFRLGVLVVDLQVALLSQNPEQASAMTYPIRDLLKSIDLAEPIVQSYEVLRLGLTGHSYLQLSELNASTSRLIEEEVHFASYSFGQWSEASRLAALLQNGVYFRRPDFQRELEFFTPEADGERRRKLERLRDLTRGGVTREELVSIAQVLDTIVRSHGSVF